ncbi:cbb3-type cytochrome c oxidase subunit 3 [Mesorhizobium sp. BR1-1-16]|uniref:cbb3-type cytochrome oxidase subunit 3 n=1 Tax=Mesorhizobium sp. BR1-1-16 TaxID=2876653 RepID=UPI001CCA58F6|nr:cbb3-type cytochrome c oxidase subunit 3 [Mesorhizobium sp. BR1-1-16]MBZ9936809.1 cbb3-type cytochrome c oxidase subunit 3 [Mesorhizobium sp. BR1-1-16]HWJ73841.1 cbb3-type cytochrome c oxidase subunit 3 [Kaistia sp.]
MMDYETLRHFADSWGLVYMVAIFLAVIVFIFRPGAKAEARDAALIPFRDPTGEDRKP